MPSAVTAIFGGDSRPMEAEFSKSEVVARRFGKTMQEVNAEIYGQENAMMLRNRDAVRALIAEKTAAIAELERYNATLEKNSGGLKTVASANAADDAAMLANSAALKALNAQRTAAKLELERYNAALMANASGLATVATANEAEDAELIRKSALLKKVNAERLAMKADAARYAGTTAGGVIDARGQNALDQEAWLIKLAAAKGITVETLKAQQAAKALALEARGFSSGISRAAGHMPGLNLVLRESLVILREIGRGNWSRVPGSFTLILQGLRNMRSHLGILGGLFTLTGFLATAAIGGIIASIFIWRHRVQELTKDLENLNRVELPKPDISRLSAYEAGWRRVRDLIQEAADEINSANHAFEVQKTFLDQSQSTEKKLLEIQKQKEMDNTLNDPAQKAAVRLKYLKLEHDLEVKQQNETLANDAKHIMALQADQDSKMAAANAIKVMTAADEKSTEEAYKKQVEENNKLEKDNKGKDMEGSSPLQQAQKTVDDLTEQSQKHLYDSETGADLGEQGLGTDDQARLQAAKDKVAQGQLDERKLEDFERTKKDRDDLREQQAKLYEQAGAAGADKIKAAKAYNEAKGLDANILADDDKIRKAEADQEGAKDLTKQEEHEKRGYGLNANQRIGAYAATPPDFRTLTQAAIRTASNTDHLKPPANSKVGSKPPAFGPVSHSAHASLYG